MSVDPLMSQIQAHSRTFQELKGFCDSLSPGQIRGKEEVVREIAMQFIRLANQESPADKGAALLRSAVCDERLHEIRFWVNDEKEFNKLQIRVGVVEKEGLKPEDIEVLRTVLCSDFSLRTKEYYLHHVLNFAIRATNPELFPMLVRVFSEILDSNIDRNLKNKIASLMINNSRGQDLDRTISLLKEIVKNETLYNSVRLDAMLALRGVFERYPDKRGEVEALWSSFPQELSSRIPFEPRVEMVGLKGSEEFYSKLRELRARYPEVMSKEGEQRILRDFDAFVRKNPDRKRRFPTSWDPLLQTQYEVTWVDAKTGLSLKQMLCFLWKSMEGLPERKKFNVIYYMLGNDLLTQYENLNPIDVFLSVMFAIMSLDQV